MRARVGSLASGIMPITVAGQRWNQTTLPPPDHRIIDDPCVLPSAVVCLFSAPSIFSVREL